MLGPNSILQILQKKFQKILHNLTKVQISSKPPLLLQNNKILC